MFVSLHEILARSPLPAGTKFLLQAAHFEEVFQCRKQDRNQAAAFVALLREACKHPDIFVLVSTHSGASGYGFRDLSRLLKQGMYSTSCLWSGGNDNTAIPETRQEEAGAEYSEPAVERTDWRRFSFANYAQVLLAQGKLGEGRTQLDAAFKHYSADYPQSLLLELWFYRFAHFPADYPRAQAEITKLLEKGERDEGWDFSGNLTQAEKAGHPQQALLKLMAAVILAEAEFETLASLSINNHIEVEESAPAKEK